MTLKDVETMLQEELSKMSLEEKINLQRECMSSVIWATKDDQVALESGLAKGMSGSRIIYDAKRTPFQREIFPFETEDAPNLHLKIMPNFEAAGDDFYHEKWVLQLCEQGKVSLISSEAKEEISKRAVGIFNGNEPEWVITGLRVTEDFRLVLKLKAKGNHSENKTRDLVLNLKDENDVCLQFKLLQTEDELAETKILYKQNLTELGDRRLLAIWRDEFGTMVYGAYPDNQKQETGTPMQCVQYYHPGVDLLIQNL